MESPPWSQAPTADAEGARKQAVIFWAVLVAVALVFVAIGLRRQTVDVGPVDVSRDGRTLSFFTNTCDQDLSATVVESPTAVTIHATANRAYCGGGACADGLEVRLAEPLGDRQVIDAATGQGVPATATEGPP